MSTHDAGTEVQLTEEEVERFAAKLAAWGDELPAQEQHLLRLMLESAHAGSEAGSEVEGFCVAGTHMPDTPLSTATLDVLRPIAQPHLDRFPTDTFGRTHG